MAQITELDRQKIKALQLARKLIVDGREFAICLALLEAASTRPHLDNAVGELVSYIRVQLGQHVYYSDWVEKNRPEFAASLPSMLSRAVYKVGRIAWIDWMIAQLKVPA